MLNLPKTWAVGRFGGIITYSGTYACVFFGADRHTKIVTNDPFSWPALYFKTAFQNHDRPSCMWATGSFKALLGVWTAGEVYGKRAIRIFVPAVFLAFLSSTCITGIVAAGQEETLMGTVVKRGKVFVNEAEDGDYILKGKDVSKLVGNWLK